MTTNKRIVIYPYKMGSQSAKALAHSVGALRVYADGTYRPRSSDVIINWGNTKCPRWDRSGMSMLNMPQNVAIAVDKLATYTRLREKGVPTLDFTTDFDKAYQWLCDGYSVYSRGLTRASGGRGIQFVDNPDSLLGCPLYTKAKTAHGEYRVHIAFGKVIDYTKKRQRLDREYTQDEMRVRNHDNGWVFCREHLTRLDRVEDIAKKAMSALGLDFGAIDILMDRDGRVFVLEVNTACGLEGTTLEVYKEFIESLV